MGGAVGGGEEGVVEMNEPGPTAADHPAHCDHSYVERSERSSGNAHENP